MKDSTLYRALILIPSQRIAKGILLIVMLAFSSLLDLVSLASFFPLIILSIKHESLAGDNLISRVFQYSGLVNTVDFAIALTICTIILIITKTLFHSWVTSVKARYAYSVASSLASRVVDNFLGVTYTRYTSSNYATEMNRLGNLPLYYANNFINPAGTLLSEALIVLALLAGLAYYDARALTAIAVMMIPFVLVYNFRKRRIKAHSDKIKTKYPELLRNAMQLIEGLPEIRSYRKQGYFKSRFEQSFEAVGKIFSAEHVMHTSTARITELMAGTIIGGLILYVLLTGRSSEETLVLLMLYSTATLRIIPSVNRIFTAALQIKTHEYVVDELTEMLSSRKIVETTVSEIDFAKTIEVRNLHFSHGTHAVLKDLSITIRKREKIVLSGQSGSGKSTLFLVLMRFLKESAGQMLVDGKEIGDSEKNSLAQKMGLVPQQPHLLDTTLKSNIAFGVPEDRLHDEKILEVLTQVGLNDWVEALPQKIDTVIGERGIKTSGGQRQRIALARALYHDAEILLLDEITNQLDHDAEVAVRDALTGDAFKNKTILLITHRPELCKEFDSMYELKDGKLNKVRKEKLHDSLQV